MEVSLVREHRRPVRQLAGFRKGHRVPDLVNDAARRFVSQIAAGDIRRAVDEIRDRLRREFRFKRLDLKVDGPTEGGGTIITPFFTFMIEVILCPDDPSEVRWYDRVTDIKELRRVASDAFDAVFQTMFDTVEISLPGHASIETFIDRIEEADDDRITIDYDTDCTRCTIGMKGVGGEIQITDRTLKIVKQKPEIPCRLLQSLFEMQKIFAASDIRLIPPASDAG